MHVSGAASSHRLHRPIPAFADDTPMLQPALDELDAKLQRLIAAYRQEKLEKKRALLERDRLLALNAELKRRIETVVERMKVLEQAPSPLPPELPQ